MQPIRTLDMFSGIGGFRSGLEAIGGFSFVGHCEIDKYANQAYEAIYQPKGELYYEDARKIDPDTLPDIDLICGGFPCQSFSIAGKRKGFDDTRGTLFFEIARIAAVKRPKYLLLENVPGLLSHDSGRTFATILSALDELGYDVTWQVLNSKDFGVPQSRQRVYIVGYLRGECAGQILSFTESNGKALVEILPGKQGERIYRADGLSCTLTSNGGGFASHTGLYEMELPIKVLTKSGYQIARPGDSINLAYETLTWISDTEKKIENLHVELAELQNPMVTQQIKDKIQSVEEKLKSVDITIRQQEALKHKLFELNNELRNMPGEIRRIEEEIRSLDFNLNTKRHNFENEYTKI